MKTGLLSLPGSGGRKAGVDASVITVVSVCCFCFPESIPFYSESKAQFPLGEIKFSFESSLGGTINQVVLITPGQELSM